MRLAYLLLLVCACGTEEGTLLTIRAPAGPDHVARLEIVLANADQATITDLADQRVAPSTLEGETVRYYRQRATAGAIESVGAADGFTVRIEPNLVMVPEKTFIPFLVAFDAQDNVIGVGAVLDLEGNPSTVDIESGTTVQYIVDMVALSPMDPALGMGERESMRVVCEAWTSGIAWRPGATQLRLLLAERGTGDATERLADLDCDGFEAKVQDCDDLRAAFNPAAAEQCDGIDSNCDAARTAVQACSATQCPGDGLQLCDDRTGEPIGACVANAQCACADGQCNMCMLAYRDTAVAERKAPCAPAVGKMHFPQCAVDGAPCTIEVLQGSGGWIGYIAASPTGNFSTTLANVTVGYAYLEAKLAGASDVEGQPRASIGSLNLVITQNGQSTLVPVDLRLDEGASDQCQATPASTYAMYCTP